MFPTEGFGTENHRWFVADHGAQVMAWQSHGRPVIWAAPDELWEVAEDDQDGGVIRGGIPVCLPWFGGGGVPSHGVARRQNWERVSDSLTDERLEVEHWIILGELEATQVVTMTDDELQVALTVTNNSASPRRIEAAHHTYFAVGGVDDCEIAGLAGAPIWDAAADTISVYDDDRLAVTPGTDKVFTHDGILELTDRAWGRRIRLVREGFTQAVIWNSRPAVDASLGVTNDRWNEFVCIESATIRELAATLDAGESRTYLTRVSVTEL